MSKNHLTSCETVQFVHSDNSDDDDDCPDLLPSSELGSVSVTRPAVNTKTDIMPSSGCHNQADAIANGHNATLQILGSDSSDDGDDGIEDEAGQGDTWKTQDGAQVTCDCIVCDYKTKGYEAADTMKTHLESTHNLSFERLKTSFKLDYIGFVQLVRWARDLKQQGIVEESLRNIWSVAADSAPWLQDKYLMPSADSSGNEDYFLTLDYFAAESPGSTNTTDNVPSVEDLISEVQRLKSDQHRMVEVIHRILLDRKVDKMGSSCTKRMMVDEDDNLERPFSPSSSAISNVMSDMLSAPPSLLSCYMCDATRHELLGSASVIEMTSDVTLAATTSMSVGPAAAPLTCPTHGIPLAVKLSAPPSSDRQAMTPAGAKKLYTSVPASTILAPTPAPPSDKLVPISTITGRLPSNRPSSTVSFLPSPRSSCIINSFDQVPSRFRKKCNYRTNFDLRKQRLNPVTSGGSMWKASSSDELYFDSYNEISIHQEMIFDIPRTEAYRLAIEERRDDINGKLVMDVGCGTGILSMFCAQHNPKCVYAVDNSEIIYDAMSNGFENNFDSTIKYYRRNLNLEELEDGVEKVDVIVSEFMGYFLFFEGMTETFLRARDFYLKPGGVLLPDRCAVYLAPIGPEGIYRKKVKCWDDAFGFKMPSMKTRVLQETHIETVTAEECIGEPVNVKRLDLVTCDVKDVYIESDFQLVITRDSELCGLVGYFSVDFTGVNNKIVLSTSPWDTPTHWQQTVFFLPRPFDVKSGDVMDGHISSCPHKDNPRWLVVHITLAGNTMKYEFH